MKFSPIIFTLLCLAPSHLFCKTKESKKPSRFAEASHNALVLAPIALSSAIVWQLYHLRNRLAELDTKINDGLSVFLPSQQLPAVSQPQLGPSAVPAVVTPIQPQSDPLAEFGKQVVTRENSQEFDPNVADEETEIIDEATQAEVIRSVEG